MTGELAKVHSFLKLAFIIDGEVQDVPVERVRALLLTHQLNVFELTDSKRGTFYVGTFKQRSV